KERTQQIAFNRDGIDTTVTIMFQATTFDFSNYNIPFFVTGYYRPNTTAGLASLMKEVKGNLRTATYIERFRSKSARHKDYIRYAATVDSIFRRVQRTCLDTVMLWFSIAAKPDEYLEIALTGYADPNPITGNYIERERISYSDTTGAQHTLRYGDAFNNESLSGARAHYSVSILRRLLERSPQFRALVKQGRIIIKPVAGGASNTSATDRAAQRRIRIEFTKRSKST
ncbi:MAG: hypothetical protein JNL32_10340, partial [Candidatus Kapabacteria bacterium]|nr:hypothetical protein [Candidatus Kapabacteria bacterium]